MKYSGKSQSIGRDRKILAQLSGLSGQQSSRGPTRARIGTEDGRNRAAEARGRAAGARHVTRAQGRAIHIHTKKAWRNAAPQNQGQFERTTGDCRNPTCISKSVTHAALGSVVQGTGRHDRSGKLQQTKGQHESFIHPRDSARARSSTVQGPPQSPLRAEERADCFKPWASK